MRKGTELYAPWPEGGSYRVKIAGARSKEGILVRWLEGPLTGREARIPALGLSATPGGAAIPEPPELPDEDPEEQYEGPWADSLGTPEDQDRVATEQDLAPEPEPSQEAVPFMDTPPIPPEPEPEPGRSWLSDAMAKI